MKISNRLKKISRALLIILLVFLVLNITGILILRFQSPAGLHSYKLFGESVFEMSIDGDDGRRFLNDDWNVYVAEVERFYEKGDVVYVIGYHSDTGVNAKIPRFPSFANLIDQDKRIKYYSLEDIPRYMILNFKTAEMQLYRTLDEVPEEQRQYFTKNLNWWCDLMRTCYEEK